MRSFTTSVLYSLANYVFYWQKQKNKSFFPRQINKKVENETYLLYNMFINIIL